MWSLLGKGEGKFIYRKISNRSPGIIRIITFSGEGGGRLLEAVVLANYV